MLLRRYSFLKRNFDSLCQPACCYVNECNKTLLGSVATQSSAVLLMRRFGSVANADNSLPTGGDPTKIDDDVDRKLKFIEMEMTTFRDHGHRVPELSSVKPQHWKELLKLQTSSARRKYYNFLFTIEKKKEAEKMKRQERARSYEAFKGLQVKEDNPHISYSLANVSMLLRIYDRTMDLWRNNKLRRAMQFGDKIVFDCSYDQYMSKQEANSAAKQLMYAFAENRLHQDPFDLHFCNVNFNGDTFNRLNSHIPNLRQPEFPLNMYERSYLELFPKEQLVYLTPHCRNDLTEYDSDSIYIIGAMVDTKNHEPLSLIKAKELGLKMARLPLDRYLDWGASSGKTLTLDAMMKIMLNLKTSRSWTTALKHVPKRKLVIEDRIEPKEIRKWSTNSDKFKKNFARKLETFDDHSEQLKKDTLSTAEKFKRKIGASSTSSHSETTNKFERNLDPNVDFTPTVPTADRLKKFNRTNGKTTTSRVNVKKLLSE